LFDEREETEKKEGKKKALKGKPSKALRKIEIILRSFC